MPTDPAIPNTRWFGETDANYNGNDVMRSGQIGDGAISCFEAAISQVPAANHRYEVKFYWQVSSEENADHLKFYVDNTEIESISGLRARTQVSYFLDPNAAAVFKWCYEKDAAANTSSGQDRGWLDQFELSEHQVLSEADALDITGTPSLSITNQAAAPGTTGSTRAWLGQSNTHQNGSDALESGSIGDSQSSCFETSVTGPGSVSFYWKVSSQLGSDHLRFYENDVEQGRISGDVNWSALEHVIESSGSRTLKWCYEKDAAVSAGSDRAWVDLLAYSSNDVPAALDLTGALLATGITSPASAPSGNSAWFSQKTNYESGITANDDALQSARIGDNQNSCFETTLDAAANTWLLLQFYWKLSSEPGGDHLKFYIDNTERKSISGDVDWSGESYTLYNTSMSTVSYALRWCYEKNGSTAGGLDRAWVDALEIVNSGGVITAADALDTTSTISTSALNGNDWFGQNDSSLIRDGVDALQSGSIGDNEQSCFETNVTGPQQVSFYWKVSSQPNADYLRFYDYDSASPPVNPVPVREISGDVNWTMMEHTVGGGSPRTLKWCYEKNASWSVGSDSAWVDALSFTAPLPIADALDNTTQTFTTPAVPPVTAPPNSNLAWFGQSSTSNDGTDALQSAGIGDDQSSCFETSVTTGSDLYFVEFSWKIDSEANGDHLRLYVDGAAVREISGDVDWTAAALTLVPRPSNYVLKWCYEKNSTGTSGRDTAWVDEVDIRNGGAGTLSTVSSVAVETALGLTTAPVLSGDADWFGLQESIMSILSESSAQSGLIGNNQSSCMLRDLTLTSASKLEFDWQVSSEENGDYLKFYVDDDAGDGVDNYVEKRSISGTVSRSTVEYIFLSSGSYRLRWCYEKNGSGAAGRDAGTLLSTLSGGAPENVLRVSPLVTATEQNALDLPSPSPLTLTNPANDPLTASLSTAWFGQTATANDGTDALQSGNIGHNQSSCFETSLSGPNQISFYWKVSSQENADYLKFYVDDMEAGSISGDVDWTLIERSIATDTAYTLKWCYHKDANSTANLDSAWMDQLVISSSTLTVSDALDNTGLSFTTPAAAPSANLAWFGQTTDTNDGTDALQSGVIGDNQSSCFETSVTGIQRVNFYWKVSSQENGDHLRFYVDNIEIRSISGDVNWTAIEHIIETGGSHTLRWCYEKDADTVSNRDAAWIDQLSLAAPIPIADALDLPSPAPSLTNPADIPSTTSLSTAAWFGQTAAANDGADALQSGTIGDNQSSCFEASVTGVQSVNFYWKVSSQESGDHLRFYVDDVEIENISGDVDWRQVRYIIETAGAHSLKWCYQKDLLSIAGLDRAWVDQLEISIPPTAADALDISGQSFSTPAPSRGWFGQTVITNDGTDAMQSGSIGNNQSSCFETDISGPVNVSFYWKVSSQYDWDRLRFLIDDAVQDQISGERDWEQKSYVLAANRSYTLRWCYRKVLVGTSGADRSWVDQLSTQPLAVIDSQTALDNTNYSFTLSGDANWFGQTVTANDGTDAMRSGGIGDNEESCFETDISGPINLSFYWKVSSEENADYLRFFIDDDMQTETSGERDWEQKRYVLSGNQNYGLKWCYQKNQNTNRGADGGWVDQLENLPYISASDALDAMGQSFTVPAVLSTDGQGWFGQTSVSQNGGDALQSGPIGRYQESCFAINVNGPVNVSFYWRVSSDSYDNLRVSIDGVLQDAINGFQPWTQKSYTLPENRAYALRWCYEKSGAGTEGADAGWIDQLSIQALPSIGAQTALDHTSHSFSLSGDANWFGQSETTRDGIDAFQSGRIDQYQESCFETNVQGPVNVSFYWRTFSVINSSGVTLAFYVDNTKRKDIRGSNPYWLQEAHALTGNQEYELKWCYEDSYDLRNTAWVDQLDIRVIVPIDTQTALDNSEHSFSFPADFRC